MNTPGLLDAFAPHGAIYFGPIDFRVWQPSWPARTLQDNDDDLLKAMRPVFDALYAGYGSEKP